MFKLFRLLKPYRASVIAIITLMLLQSLAQLYLPTLLADIVDVGVVKGDIRYILRFGAYMLLVAMGGMVCVIIASYLFAKNGDRIRQRFTHERFLPMLRAFPCMNLISSVLPPSLPERRMISHKFSKLLS